MEGRFAQFSTQKETRLQLKAYLCVSKIQALFSLYFLCMGCFHQLMVCSCGYGKTNKYTNIHAHTHTHTHFWANNFKKSDSVKRKPILKIQDFYFVFFTWLNRPIGILCTQIKQLNYIDALSNTVNHHSYYLLFMKVFFHDHIFDPHSTCLNLQFLPPVGTSFKLFSCPCMYMDKAKYVYLYG